MQSPWLLNQSTSKTAFAPFEGKSFTDDVSEYSSTPVICSETRALAVKPLSIPTGRSTLLKVPEFLNYETSFKAVQRETDHSIETRLRDHPRFPFLLPFNQITTPAITEPIQIAVIHLCGWQTNQEGLLPARAVDDRNPAIAPDLYCLCRIGHLIRRVL